MADTIAAKFFGITEEERKLQKASLREARDAMARAFHAEAYRSMPGDMRERARVWGVSSLMEAVWMNAWECGYKQAIRDAETVKETNL